MLFSSSTIKMTNIVALIGARPSQPATDAGLVLFVGVSEPRRQILLFGQNDSVVDEEDDRHRRQKRPWCVHDKCQAHIEQRASQKSGSG